MPKDLVSIIVPAFRAERFLSATLKTVEHQTHRDWELLITEDASNDSTEDLVAAFRERNSKHRVVFTRHNVNSGPSASRNTGIEQSRGSYIALLDADDLWSPDHLDISVRTLRDTQSDVVYSTTLMFDDETGALLGLWGPSMAECSEFPNGLYKRNFIVPSSTVLRRSVCETVGLFDTNPNIQGCEDIDFWLRCVESGLKFQHITGLHCMYRKGHEEAATTRIGRLLPRQVAVLEKHFGMSGIPKPVQRDGLSRFKFLASLAQVRHDQIYAANTFFGAWRLKPIRFPFSAAMTLLIACAKPSSVKSFLANLRP
ncbi:MAG: glycosyltransferase [Planctomycetota bacterium]